MLFIRSLLFTSLFVFLTAWVCVTSVILYPFKSLNKVLVAYVTWWSKMVLWLADKIVGLKLEVKGLEYLPKGEGYIIASKHQSAFDTVLFHSFLYAPSYIFKIELARVPFMGKLLKEMDCISVDRKGGTRAMRDMFNEAKVRLERGKAIIIFPEGTRMLPDAEPAYNPGVAMIYEHTGAKVVPAAIDAGYLWSKNSFLKKKGTVTLQFLPPIEAGLNKREFLNLLQNQIESAMDNLKKEKNRS